MSRVAGASSGESPDPFGMPVMIRRFGPPQAAGGGGWRSLPDSKHKYI